MDLLTIDRIVFESARKHRDRTALERLDPEGRRVGFTYGELAKRMELVARGMVADGLRPGDRVGILGANSPSWGLAALAALHCGAVLVPVDQKATRKELAHVLDHAGAKRLLISHAAFEKMQSLPPVEKVYFLDRASEGERFTGLENLAAEGAQEAPVAFEARGADDLALIVYTSGTTGDPKGVMLTHRNVLTNLEMIMNRLQATETDAFTSILPLSHMLEFTCGFCLPLAVGASVHYVGNFNPVDIIKTMSTCEGTVMIAVPRLYQAMWKKLQDRMEGLPPMKKRIAGAFQAVVRRAPGLGKLLFRQIHARFGGRTRFWVSGGAALDPAIAEGFRAIGVPILNGYGLTETAPVLCANSEEENDPRTVGRPLPGVELRIFDANQDGIGEVAARGPNITAGYYKNKEATRETFRDGWFLTGDLGKISPSGKLELRGRSKNLIVTPNGKNVHPEELEECLKRSRLLEDVGVLGVPTDGGEVVTAVVVPGAELATLPRDERHKRALKEVRALTAELSDYKRPRRVLLWDDELPKTHTMKLKRRDLLEAVLESQAAAEGARRIERQSAG